MEITLTQWFAIAIAAVAVCFITYRTGSYILSSSFMDGRFQDLGLKHLHYPLLVIHFSRFHSYRTGITRLQASVVGSYFFVNGLCMGLGIRREAIASDLMTRSAFMASINIIPLFLGGRTNLLANYLGISIHTYYLAHHWIGRIVIFQSLLHVALAIANGTPWTFNSSQIYGITVSSPTGYLAASNEKIGHFSAGAALPVITLLHTEIGL